MWCFPWQQQIARARWLYMQILQGSLVGHREKIVMAVKSFFQFGFLPKDINSTILALTPKKAKFNRNERLPSYIVL